MSDAAYPVTNTGKAAASYRVKLVGDASAAPRPLRLMVAKVQRSPTSVGCVLVHDVQTTVLLDVVDPLVEPVAESADAVAEDPAAARGRAGTFALRPGETAYVTLRGHPEQGQGASLVNAVVPVVIPEGGKGAFASPLTMVPAGGELPPARYGASYSAELTAFGGKKPYSWTAVLPAGLAVAANGSKGRIEGVPLETGNHELVVRLNDGETASPAVERRFVVEVSRARTRLEVVAPGAVPAGVPFEVAVRVVPEGEGIPSGTIRVEGEGGHCSFPAPAGACTLAFGARGRRTIKATFEGDRLFEPAEESGAQIDVGGAGAADEPSS